MSPIFSLILFAAVISAQSDPLSAGEKRSAHDTIKDYNFPVGTHPIGVNAATGKSAAVISARPDPLPAGEKRSAHDTTKDYNFPVGIHTIGVNAATGNTAAVISAQSDPLPAGEKRSAYDIVKDYNFPVGILPIGVRDYELDAATGKFAAFYNKTCSFSLEGSYQLQYKSTIKGVISKNRLTDLEGVKVKLWFVWVDIVEVSRKGDNLSFSVGIAGADFGVENFEECPQCGCGLNCGSNEEIKKLDLVSSY